MAVWAAIQEYIIIIIIFIIIILVSYIRAYHHNTVKDLCKDFPINVLP